MSNHNLTPWVTVGDLAAFEDRMKAFIKQVVEQSSERKAFYSAKEFAQHTGLGYAAVTHRCRNGLLKAHQEAVGSTWLIEGSEIDRFKEEAEFNHWNNQHGSGISKRKL